MLVKYRAIENGFLSSFVFWCDCTISFILEMHFSTDSLNVSRKGSFVTELNSMALLSDFLSARVQVNVDFWGADIRSFRSKGLRDCYNHCRRQRGCLSFTMRKKDGYCWLKKRHNGARRKTNRRHLVSANMVGKGPRTGNMNSLSRSEGKSFSKTDRLYGDCSFFNIESVRGLFVI